MHQRHRLTALVYLAYGRYLVIAGFIQCCYTAIWLRAARSGFHTSALHLDNKHFIKGIQTIHTIERNDLRIAYIGDLIVIVDHAANVLSLSKYNTMQAGKKKK